ncbi:HEAT 2 domain containing protein [Lysobacter dokdonensis DS-58]|uniref:HEAT 2 domain containing protein n=1 Tax=Lysobacter dokdonensis DS-58 TaxID=1300345 RepID=A0A0A2X248_9GAMM|nr:HEAT repeat domain-containing protein [Lysobacter dokdonensis]KGQ19299.1 HEAT 2 domain containing protein [Lysobacter dokdonensis DS-58]
MKRHAIHAALSASLLLLAGCAPGSYAVKDPSPSNVPYATTSAATTTLGIHHQSAGAAPFFSGRLPATLDYSGKPLQPAAFLEKSLQAEFAARGLPITVSSASDATTFPRLDVAAFNMKNWRTNAYTPFITFTSLSTDLETATGKKHIAVFVKRGKVPVWSFDEIVEPTLNEPLSLAVKELASKVAFELYGAKASDEAVDALADKVTHAKDDNYLDVYALGFTNNARAIPTLAKLTTADAEYVRMAAISSLGNLRAVDQFDLLKNLSTSANLWQDRAMAIKAIGDLDTPEGRAYLGELKTRMQSSKENEAKWTVDLISLYI